jgi:hypothetical protein
MTPIFTVLPAAGPLVVAAAPGRATLTAKATASEHNIDFFIGKKLRNKSAIKEN